jgi:hypothetical protein
MARPLQSLRLRQVTVSTLRGEADLTALGSPALNTDTEAKRIYGRRSPSDLTWPFLRVNLADESPLRKGTTVRLTVHCFSKAQFDDEVEQLNAAVQTALEDAVLELSPATKAFIAWRGSQVIPDSAEANAWHGVNSFDASIG